ncbi:MAG: 4-hydroxy-tetrahydrodipicolinate reductase [Deltaproteobacteria bacterium]|nr:4-hydroxy-tetrahydrodipicolinate reductase [Deltaproteobacteria bacterium]
MGRRVVRLAAADSRFVLCGALERGGAAGDAGEQAGTGRLGVALSSDPAQALSGAQVAVAFSAPPACADLASVCAQHKVAYLVASTGLSDEDRAALKNAAQRIAVLEAANLSIAVNVLSELVETAAARLGQRFDIEIQELHHRHKRDAPSGTALLLADSAGRGRSGLRNVAGRAGTRGARDEDELGISALRGGDVAGEHTVYFLSDGERLELSHRANSPDIFAVGALTAAHWLTRQGPGLFSMRQVLRR